MIRWFRQDPTQQPVEQAITLVADIRVDRWTSVRGRVVVIDGHGAQEPDGSTVVFRRKGETELSADWFFLEDASGRVLINPSNAAFKSLDDRIVAGQVLTVSGAPTRGVMIGGLYRGPSTVLLDSSRVRLRIVDVLRPSTVDVPRLSKLVTGASGRDDDQFLKKLILYSPLYLLVLMVVVGIVVETVSRDSGR